MRKLFFSIVAFSFLLLSVYLFQLTLSIYHKKIVQSDAAYLVTTCKGSEACYSNGLAAITKKHDMDYAIEVLKILHTKDPLTRGCHLMAHYIAIAQTEKDPGKWMDLLSHMDINICTGGLLHGVIETHARHDKSFSLNPVTINKLCTFIVKTYGDLGEFNCSHIMGHILLAQNKGDIPSTIDLCKKVEQSFQFGCYSGVFMENETRENIVIYTDIPHITWDDAAIATQEAICSKYSGTIAVTCWREMMHMYYIKEKGDASRIYADCQKAPDEDSRNECYLHGVAFLTITPEAGDERAISNYCKPYFNKKDLLKRCYFMPIRALVGSSLEFADRIVTLCNSLPNDYTTDCYKTLGARVALVPDKKKREEICKRIPQRYVDICLNTK